MIKIPEGFELGTVHKTLQNGDIVVIGYKNSKNMSVRFVETGFVSKATTGRIRTGKIKDKLRPVVHGVGFIGVGKYVSKSKGKQSKLYDVWAQMLNRCYNKKCQDKHPTYKGCSVCDDWHNFQNFALWSEGKYKEGLYLDKDIKVEGHKVYSPENCIFVTRLENNIKASAKGCRFISPSGDLVEIYNLLDFCRKNELLDSKMCLVHSGSRATHKGWTKYTKETLLPLEAK